MMSFVQTTIQTKLQANRIVVTVIDMYHSVGAIEVKLVAVAVNRFRFRALHLNWVKIYCKYFRQTAGKRNGISIILDALLNRVC